MTPDATPRSSARAAGLITRGVLPRDDVPAIASAMAALAQHLFGLLPLSASGSPEAAPVPAPASLPEALSIPASVPMPAAAQAPHVQQVSATIPLPVLPEALPLPELPPAATAPATPRAPRSTSLLDEISFLDD